MVFFFLFLCAIQTRKTAGWLAGELSREGHQVALLSGEMQVEQRAAVIDRFRDGKEKVLVTTNVCARGKDDEVENKGNMKYRLGQNLQLIVFKRLDCCRILS